MTTRRPLEERIDEALLYIYEDEMVALACAAIEQAAITPHQLRRVLRAMSLEVQLPERYERWMELDRAFDKPLVSDEGIERTLDLEPGGES